MFRASLSELDRFLQVVDRRISLLDRVRPDNAEVERARVTAAWEAGAVAAPELVYSRAPDLSEAEAVLERVAAGLPEAGELEPLYVDRARELHVEARLIALRGTPGFRGLAEVRFPSPTGAELPHADARAVEWAEPPPESLARQIGADDEHDPESLSTQIRVLVGRLRLPVRVLSRPDLASAAATGEGVIAVRSGAFHSPASARRIAAHEVYGHALPRCSAHRESVVWFRLGTAGAAADEEGRALLLEQRLGVADCASRYVLGVRHLVARAVRAGADFPETVRVALAQECGVRMAVDLAFRSHRGGGLAREIVYLPALFRVEAALAEDPELDGWLARGRLSLEGARLLRAVDAQSKVAMTGT